MATPKWLKDVMDKSSRASGMARSRANAPTKEELQKANKQAKEYLTNIGLTMLPVGLVGTKVGQALAKGYGKAIAGGITNTLKRGGSGAITPKFKVKGMGVSGAADDADYVIRYMTPKEFMSVVPKEYNRRKAKDLIIAMKKGKTINAPELIVNPKGVLKVIDHEGRHRVQVSNLLQGNKKIPVKIRFDDSYKSIVRNIGKRKIRKSGKKILNPNRSFNLSHKKSASDILPKSYAQKVTMVGQEGSAAQRFKRRFKKDLKVK
jgi:hypothetical protein